MPAKKIYKTNAGKVYAFFYAKTLHRQLAEDLTSESFVLFVEQINSRDINDKAKYLYGIVKNVWMNYLRSKYKEQLEFYENIEDFQGMIEQNQQQLEAESYIQRAEKYIVRLPQKQQLIARLRFLDGLSPKAISLKIGKDMSYVKTTQNRALKSLRKMLESEGAGL